MNVIKPTPSVTIDSVELKFGFGSKVLDFKI